MTDPFPSEEDAPVPAEPVGNLPIPNTHPDGGPRSIVFVNEKPGTAKSTSAVLTALALHEDGQDVVLIDGDVNGKSVMGWHNAIGGFPFRVFQMPSVTLHQDIPKTFADPKTRIVIDAPPLENQPGIARSAMRYADLSVIPVAPSSMETERMGDIRDEINDLGPLTLNGICARVLLNRCIPQAKRHNRLYRNILVSGGWNVFDTAIPMVTEFQGAWGKTIEAGGGEYDQLLVELGIRQTRDDTYDELVSYLTKARENNA
ncbi:hypothetical protein HEP81_08103 (plasmid) [Streptomyces griseofuscus]|uniref:Chromosome partitioning protein n=1 Tax=Streptomyces griseofuscus TaxID=146922 RepID=A0A7H1QDF1_9ACTN|nr:ParA family protein [Streptomyces griseofuscus]QNT98331.1 hypothetical protein HEP81_08103 [Streptomyces griseofuscus]